jgi:hypothetical protein
MRRFSEAWLSFQREVRVEGPDARSRQGQRLAILAPQGPLPSSAGVSMIEWRDSRPRTRAIPRDGGGCGGKSVEPCAQKNGRPHAVPVPDLPPFDWDERSRRNGFPTWAMPLGSFLIWGNKALARDERRVLIHNDVNPANLVWDGSRVWMVDSERAALAHPYLDLATFSMFVNLSDDDALGLLAIQESSAISPEQRTMLYLAA